MDEFDRGFLMSQAGSPCGSLEQLVNMARKGYIYNAQPSKPEELAEALTLKQE